MSSLTTRAQVDALDHSTLTPLVRQALQRPTIDIDAWQVRPFGELLNPTTGGLFRVSGSGRDQGAACDWSLVLKVVCAPDAAAPEIGAARRARAARGGTAHDSGRPVTRERHCAGAVQ